MEKREIMDGELHGEARAARASFVTWIGLVVNIVLTAFKYLAGFLGHSGAMIADATHSLSDLITDVVVILGFRIVSKPADHGHDYGHLAVFKGAKSSGASDRCPARRGRAYFWHTQMET